MGLPVMLRPFSHASRKTAAFRTELYDARQMEILEWMHGEEKMAGDEWGLT